MRLSWGTSGLDSLVIPTMLRCLRSTLSDPPNYERHDKGCDDTGDRDANSPFRCSIVGLSRTRDRLCGIFSYHGSPPELKSVNRLFVPAPALPAPPGTPVNCPALAATACLVHPPAPPSRLGAPCP